MELSDKKIVSDGAGGSSCIPVSYTHLHAVDRPVKVMQFGEGNFLRAFVDYIFDVTNEKTDFNGGVVIVKDVYKRQNWG